MSSKLEHEDEENDVDNTFVTMLIPNTSATRRLVLRRIVQTTTIGTSGGIMAMAVPGSATAATASTAHAITTVESPAIITSSRSTYWPLGKVAFSLLPLAGTYTRRATILETVCAAKGSEERDGVDTTTIYGMTNGRVWTLDQIQGVVNVNVPVRMVVIKVSASILQNNHN